MSKFLKKFFENGVRRRITMALVILVVFVTTYALVLPAITISREVTPPVMQETIGDVTVTVEVPDGAFPAGTIMNLELIELDEDNTQKVLTAAEAGEDATVVRAVDISFEYDGEEIEPAKEIRVTMTTDAIKEISEPVVVHLDDAGEATRVALLTEEDIEGELEANELTFNKEADETAKPDFEEIEPGMVIDRRENVETPDEETVGDGVLDVPSDDADTTDDVDTPTDAETPDENVVQGLAPANGDEIAVTEEAEPTEETVGDGVPDVPSDDAEETVGDGVPDVPSDEAEPTEETVGDGVLDVPTDDTETTEETEETDSVTFDAESFSVYVIVDANGDTTTVRATYEFYRPSTTEGEWIEYYFEDTAGNDKVYKQMIKDGDSLTDVGTLADTAEGVAFLGWYEWNTETDTWGDEVVFETPISVTAESSYTVIVRARYGTYGLVNYYTDADGVTTKDLVKVPADAGETTIYTLTGEADPPTKELAFLGWTTTKNGDSSDLVTTVEVSEGAEVKVYPVFIQVHWINFMAAPTGAGASYTAPAYVRFGETAANAKPANPTWTGYGFQYWTTEETFNADGTLKEFDTAPEPFDFTTTIPTSDIDLYAYWLDGYANYTVVFWQQSVEDDRDAADSEKIYYYADQEVISAPLNSVIKLQDLIDNNVAKNTKYTGFKLNVTNSTILNGDNEETGITVDASGSAVFNLYFDRKTIWYKFYNYQQTLPNQSQPTDGDTDSVWNTTTTTDMVLVMYGLYMQDFSKYGYEWPDGQYVYNSASSSVGYYSIAPRVQFTSVSYKAESPETRTYYYGASSVERTFYLQNLDGTYPTDPSMTISASGVSYLSLQELVNGFNIVGYRRYTTNNNGTKNYIDRKGLTNGLYVSAKAGTTVDPMYTKQTSGGGPGQSSTTTYTYYSIEFYFERNEFDIEFLDSEDNTTPIYVTTDNSDGSKIYTATLKQAASLNGYYPTSAPETGAAGKTWNGRWYTDQACTTQIFFTGTEYAEKNGEGKLVLTDAGKQMIHYWIDSSNTKYYEQPSGNSTEGDDDYVIYDVMPTHNLVLYPGWEYEYYKISIDPNGGELSNTESTYFWLVYGSTISRYDDISRNYIEDASGEYHYYYDKSTTAADDPENWDWQSGPRYAVYKTDAEAASETYLRNNWQAWSYNSAHKSTETYKYQPGAYSLLGWYKVEDNGSLSPYNFDTEVTGTVSLRAMWYLTGNISVQYSTTVYGEDGTPLGVTTENVPTDGHGYAAKSSSVILTSSAMSDTLTNDGVALSFKGWVIDFKDGNGVGTTIYTTGSTYTIPANTPEESIVMVYPVYGEYVEQDPTVQLTTITFNGNGGTWAEEGNATEISYPNIPINQDIKLSEKANNVARENYTLLGWAYTADATEAVFPVSDNIVIGVDNISGNGYTGNNTNVLYAVWRHNVVTVKLMKTDGETGLAGATFTLAADTTYELTSGADGMMTYTVENDEYTSIDLVVDADYQLTETHAPDGYLMLTSNVTIKVSADGVVTADGVTVEEKTDGEGNTYYLISVTNQQGTALPHTGGDGTMRFVVAGVAMLLFATSMVVFVKRREEMD